MRQIQVRFSNHLLRGNSSPSIREDRNIRCSVQEHQSNQWMKIIVVSQFEFLLRSTENISFR